MFFRKGVYRIKGTLTLSKHTHFCGISSTLVAIEADPSWTANPPTPLVQTVDDKNASCVLENIALKTYASKNGIYQLLWRAGRQSIVKNVIQDPRPPWPGEFQLPHKRGIITGNGGGRFYCYLQNVGWDAMDKGARHLLIDGTHEPLSFYMYHHQYLKPSGGPMTELRNARNVYFFGQKTETIIPGSESKHTTAFNTPWPIVMQINNCQNIRIYGEEGPSQAEPGRGLFELTNSSNVKIVNVGRRGDGGSSLHDEKNWFFIKETFQGKTANIDATGLVGYFRRD